MGSGKSGEGGRDDMIPMNMCKEEDGRKKTHRRKRLRRDAIGASEQNTLQKEDESTLYNV